MYWWVNKKLVHFSTRANTDNWCQHAFSLANIHQTRVISQHQHPRPSQPQRTGILTLLLLGGDYPRLLFLSWWLAWCRSGSTARGREVFTGQSRFTCHLAASTVPPNPLPHFSLSHTEEDHKARNAFSYIKRNIVGLICRENNLAFFWFYLAAGFDTYNLAKDNSLSRIGNP